MEETFNLKHQLEQSLLAMLKPLKTRFSEEKAGLPLGGFAAGYGMKIAEMEGAMRLLWGLTPYWADNGKEAEEWKDHFLNCVRHGTDPDHPAYWGDIHDRDQKIVEIAALSCNLMMTPDVIWNRMTSEEQNHLASWLYQANSAIVHAGYDAQPGSLMAKLNVRGNELMEQLSKDLDFSFQRIGSLVVCLSEEDMPGLKALYDRGIANGVKDLRILDRKEVHEMEPNLTAEVCAALYAPTAGIVCPFGLNLALAENACERDSKAGIWMGASDRPGKYQNPGGGQRSGCLCRLFS